MITEKSETSDGRLQRIDAMMDVTASGLDLDELLGGMLDEVRHLLQVDTAAVMLLDREAQQLFAAAARGLEDEVIQGLRIPVGRGFSGRVASERAPIVLDKVNSTTVSSQVVIRRGIRTLLGVPMLANGDLVGVLNVGTLTDRTFTEEDIALLRLVADRAAVASQARLTRSERAATLALQRSLLPTRLPQLSDVEMAARYLPGHHIGIGGDWYDVFVLPTGALGIVVGDVSGHGLAAAVVMGRLRSALRAYALECDDPADALTRLDQKIRHFEAGNIATVLYAMVSPAHDQVAVSLAGHLPPVIATPGESGRLLDVPVDQPVGLPLGVGRHEPRRSTEMEIREGVVVVFYTDGLVERRRQSIDDGLDRLCAATKADSVETVCATIIDSLGIEDAEDDIALLAIRRIGRATEPDESPN